MGFNIPYTDKKRVVIIGGGFGGLKLAEKLKKSKFQVVLIDKNNYHQFPPLLYQVASSGLEYNEISFPYRKIFQKRKNFYFRLAEVYGVNPKGHTIQTSIGELEYDYLVIAAGTITNFFGNKTIEEQSLPMKTVEEALALRDTLLINLEKATTCMFWLLSAFLLIAMQFFPYACLFSAILMAFLPSVLSAFPIPASPHYIL